MDPAGEDTGARSKSIRLAELAHDFGGITLSAIDLIIHAAHFFFGYFTGQSAQRHANFGMSLQRGPAYQRHRLIRRKIMSVVLQNNQMQ